MRISILFFTLFINVFVAKSQQQIVFNESKNESFLVKQIDGQNQSISNYIIRCIATSNNAFLPAVKFSYAFNQNLQIIKKNETLQLTAEMKDIHFSGDVFYKGINIEDVLFPAKLNFKLNLFSNQNVLLKSLNFTDVSLDLNSPVFLDIFEKDTFNVTGYRMEIVNKEFIYNTFSQRMFNNKIDLINEYFSLDIQLKMAFNELKAMNLDNVDLMYDFKKSIEKNDILINSISSRDFYNQLNLRIADPIFLDQRTSDLYDENTRMKQEINHILSNIFEVYYKKGMDFMLVGNYKMAENYFNKSINTNIIFAPAHFQIAKIRYIEQNYDLAIEGVKNIIHNMNADPKTRTNAYDLATSIENEYINLGIKNAKNSDFELAQNAFEKAQKICTEIRGMICSEQLENEYSKLLIAKQNKYLSDANMMIKSGLLNDAEIVLQKAKVFYQKNANLLKSDVDLMNSFSNLYNAFLLAGNQANASGKYEVAISYFKSANQICTENTQIACSDDLTQGLKKSSIGIYNSILNEAENAINQKRLEEAENKMAKAVDFQNANNLEKSDRYDKIFLASKQLKYMNLISQSDAFLINNNAQESFKLLNEAIEIETTYVIKKDAKLNTNLKKTINLLASDLINKGENSVKQNNLPEAQKQYATAQELISKYTQIKDEELNKKLNSLREKIFSQECKNVQLFFDNQYQIAVAYIEGLQFREADIYLGKALELAENNKYCFISAKNATDKKAEIQPASTYQKELKNIETMIEQGDYDQAIEKYNTTEEFYFKNAINLFGINNMPLTNFILLQKDNFVLHCAEKYTEKKFFPASILLLNELKKRNFPPKWALYAQELLGKELAIKDKAENPQEDPKISVLKYTDGDKWFNYLKKSYLKQSKLL